MRKQLLFPLVILGYMFAGIAHAATAINDVYTFTESANTPFQLPVIEDNDDYIFADTTLEITEVFSGDISWFSIVDPGDGAPQRLDLTPGAAFTTGVIEFNYKVTDSNGASEGFVSVNVIDDAAFSLADDSFFVGAGQSIVFNVTDNDTLPTEFVLNANTAGVTLGSIIAEAAIGRYTFNAGSVPGSTSFTYTVDAVPAQTGTVTIFVNEGTDPKSIVTADTTTFTVNEGGTQSVVLTRTGSTQSAISIDLSLAGSSTGDTGDFGISSSTVAWAAGESGSKTVTLSVSVDTEIEVAETLVFDFINATGGGEYSGASLVATIPSTDSVNFSAATQTINENGASVTVTANRAGTGAGAASINLQLNTGSTTATSGSDFTFTDPTTLSWGAGETGSKSVIIPVVYDADNSEATEKISLDLVSPANLIVGATNAHTVDIVNVAPLDVVSFVSGSYTVAEDGGSVVVQVQRVGDGTGAVAVDVELAAETATEGVDFTYSSVVTLNWADGVTGAQNVTVPIATDSLVEGNETFSLSLGTSPTNAALGAVDTTQVTITDVVLDKVSFVSATYAVAEEAGSINVQVQRLGAGSGAASVDVELASAESATQGVDFTFASTVTVNWADGVTGSQNVTIPISNDGAVEGAETFSLNLGTSPTNAELDTVLSTQVTITDAVVLDEVSFVSATYTVAEDGGSVTVQVQRVGAGSGVSSVNVALSAAETAAEGVDFTYAAVTTVSWADGVTGTKDIVIPIIVDAETEGDETFSLELLDSPTNATAGTVKITQVTITNVVPLDVVGLVLTDPNATEGGQITVEVTRTGSGSGAASVTLGIGAESVAELDADLSLATGSSLTVSWADGDTATQSVVFDVTADSLLEEVEAVLFELSAESNVTLGVISTISGTIADDGSITVDDLDAIGFVSVAIRAAEEVGEVVVQFVRTGAGVGVVEATVVSVLSETPNGEVLEPTIVKTVPAQGSDFTLPANTTLQWADGEVGIKTLVLQISADSASDFDGDPDGEFFSLKIDPDSLVGNIAVNEDSAEAEVVIYAQARLGDLVEEGSPVREVADAIDGLCSASSADEELDEECDQLNALDASEIETALEQVLPKTVEAQIRSAVELAGNQLQNMRRRLTELRSGRNQVSVNGLNMTLFDESVPLAAAMQSLIEESKGGAAGADEGGLLSSPWGVFINGTITVGDQDDTDGSIGYDVRSRGITAGVDYRISRTMVLGGALGFGESDTDFNQSAGSQEARNLTLTVFGNHFINDKIYADWIVSYTKNDFDIERSFEVLSGSTHQVEASPEGHQYSIAVGGGYDYVRGALQVTGFGRIDYIMSVIDSYEESGSIYALILDEQEADSLETAFGVKTSYVFSTKRSVLIPTVELEWVHQYAGDDRQIEAAFAVAPSAGSFSVETESSDDDYLNAGFSFTGTFSGGTSGYFRYDTLVNESDRSRESYTLGGRYEF